MPSKFRPRDARYVEGKGAIRRASERVSRSGEEETFAQDGKDAPFTQLFRSSASIGGRIARSARRRRRSHDSEERDSKKDYFRGVTIRIRIISLTHGWRFAPARK